MTTKPEIERVFLLKSMPELPEHSRALSIEQGYLPSSDDEDNTREGRIRRTTDPAGHVIFTHTIKTGTGLVRQETEVVIDETTFMQEWARTKNRRLEKTRHEVNVGSLLWQIDEFLIPAGLVMAEVEIPTVETEVTLPEWLTICIDREVKDDPTYRNFELARRAGLG